MPSLGDSAVIIFLGLLLFGPKGLAQIARQLGKLMGEFRRASNEFRMQMEEELRIAEQADRQKQIAAIEAAAPPQPVLASPAEEAMEEHPHLRAAADGVTESLAGEVAEAAETAALPQTAPTPPAPLPIATSGELRLMPPATGLPAPRTSSLSALIESVPRVDAPNGHAAAPANGSELAGLEPKGIEQRRCGIRNSHDAGDAGSAHDSVDSAAAAESVHG